MISGPWPRTSLFKVGLWHRPSADFTRLDRSDVSFDLADPDTGAVLPGRYHFELEGITVAMPGPWELTWNLGERG